MTASKKAVQMVLEENSGITGPFTMAIVVPASSETGM